jgi:2-phospho-L-lactate guanylyltransferase (CobY/MobA/RfbA family)
MGYVKQYFFVSSGGTSDNFIKNSLISTEYIDMSYKHHCYTRQKIVF